MGLEPAGRDVRQGSGMDPQWGGTIPELIKMAYLTMSTAERLAGKVQRNRRWRARSLVRPAPQLLKRSGAPTLADMQPEVVHVNTESRAACLRRANQYDAMGRRHEDAGAGLLAAECFGFAGWWRCKAAAARLA